MKLWRQDRREEPREARPNAQGPERAGVDGATGGRKGRDIMCGLRMSLSAIFRTLSIIPLTLICSRTMAGTGFT